MFEMFIPEIATNASNLKNQLVYMGNSSITTFSLYLPIITPLLKVLNDEVKSSLGNVSIRLLLILLEQRQLELELTDGIIIC